MTFIVKVASENALIVYCEAHSLLQNNQAISALTENLKKSNILGILDLIPAYQSVLIVFDVYKTDYYQIKHAITACGHELADLSSQKQTSNEKLITVPVCYNVPTDNDLKRIAQHNNMDVEEVVRLHSEVTYRVFCLGFAPGFAFMGETDARIATPRLDSPRKQVPQGAVAIADRQTAVYPNQSPGGWNIVGLCPVTLFNPEQQPACLFSVGDQVKFNPIDYRQYLALRTETTGILP